ncbi:cytidine deaminase [Candidatus Wolfebacteria bacterium]|nr:cytidine deaminase [Candidatus Wolfebacteria bacterium]
MNLKYEDLSADEKELLNAAEKGLTNAYNPYNSQMRVGASVRVGSGEIIIGSSIANASSSVNLCAERAALAVANSAGHRDIKAVAIIGTDSDGVVENPIMPCGMCRQFMEEFLTMNGGDIPIICSNSAKDAIIKSSLKELLPLPYAGSGEVK